MADINWGKLAVEGRVKDVGIPWTDTELNAIHVLRIPVSYVREGCLTTEDYEKAQKKVAKEVEKTGETPLEHMTKEELLGKATKLGLKVTKAATSGALIKAIKTKEKK